MELDQLFIWVASRERIEQKSNFQPHSSRRTPQTNRAILGV